MNEEDPPPVAGSSRREQPAEQPKARKASTLKTLIHTTLNLIMVMTIDPYMEMIWTKKRPEINIEPRIGILIVKTQAVTEVKIQQLILHLSQVESFQALSILKQDLINQSLDQMNPNMM